LFRIPRARFILPLLLLKSSASSRGEFGGVIIVVVVLLLLRKIAITIVRRALRFVFICLF